MEREQDLSYPLLFVIGGAGSVLGASVFDLPWPVLASVVVLLLVPMWWLRDHREPPAVTVPEPA